MEAQLISLLEWMGWADFAQDARPVGDYSTFADHPTLQARHRIPKLTLDLIHEAARQLEPHEWSNYTMAIRRIIQRDCNRPECCLPDCERAQLIADFWFYEATKEQRLEALLKTIGKWVESTQEVAA